MVVLALILNELFLLASHLLPVDPVYLFRHRIMSNSIMVVQVSTNRSSRTLLKLYSMVTSLQADHLLSAAIGTVGIEPTFPAVWAYHCLQYLTI